MQIIIKQSKSTCSCFLSRNVEVLRKRSHVDDGIVNRLRRRRIRPITASLPILLGSDASSVVG